MARITVQSPGRRAWEIVRRDHNVISYDELHGLGYTDEAIEHRVRSRRLHRQARGVFSVTPGLTKHGQLMVAVKRCGAGAVLSHLSAAVLWGICRREPREAVVTVPRRRNPRPEGIDVRRRDVGDDELTAT